MHFSRNPPGPKTSRMEGFFNSAVVASAEPSGADPAAVGPSSRGTYSRSTAFAVRFAFAGAESPGDLFVRLPRDPPSPARAATKRPRTGTYAPLARDWRHDH